MTPCPKAVIDDLQKSQLIRKNKDKLSVASVWGVVKVLSGGIFFFLEPVLTDSRADVYKTPRPCHSRGNPQLYFHPLSG